MLILGIDTSCASAGVCLWRDGDTVKKIMQADKRTHSVKLLPEIQVLLSSENILPEQLDLIAVTIGPGSFTGVRIGGSTAKTLAYAVGKPVVGVGTLDALCRSGSSVNVGELTLSLIDARNLRAYGCLYLGEKAVISSKVDKVSALLDELPEEFEGKTIRVCGDASINENIMNVLTACERFRFVSDTEAIYPDPAAVALIGYEKYCACEDKTRFTPASLRFDYMKDW